MHQTILSQKKFSNMELSAFCGQIAMILRSGISAIEGLTIMLEDSTSPDEKAVLDMLLDGMHENGILFLSMEKTGLFPDYMLHMVEIGEETGTLDEVMGALQTHYEREYTIRKNIRNAVIYPAVMTGMMITVVIVLLVKVLPIFNQVFIQLGTEMTGFSRILMNLGTGIQDYAIFFILFLVVLVTLLLYCTQTTSGHLLLKKICHLLPFTRNIFEKIATCRFASAMALTLKSGLNPERSIELVSASNEDPVFDAKLKVCTEQLSENLDIAQSLLNANIFSGMYARMIAIAAKTGEMDKVMEEIADLYQEAIDNNIETGLSILEPTLVVILSLIVGVILLSVMLPLVGIMSSI